MSEYVLTPNLGLYKPSVDADEDHWGDHLNLNADKLDSVLSTSSGLFLPLAGGQMTGPILLPDDYPVDPVEAVNKAYVDGVGGNIVDYLNGNFLKLAGGTMQGPLHLKPGSPPAADEAVPKSYVDAQAGNFVAKTGDTMTGNLTISKASPILWLNKPDTASEPAVIGLNAGKMRWGVVLGSSTAETGSNSGSLFAINRYTDAGDYLGTPIVIYRNNGMTAINTGLQVNGSDSLRLEVGGAGYGIIRYNNNNRRWWAGNTDIGNWAVFDETAQRTVLQCQTDGNVSVPVGLYSNYIGSYGWIQADGTIKSLGGRIVAQQAGGNPSVAVHSAGHAAGGMWCEDGGRLVFGWTDGNGVPTESHMWLDRAGYLQVPSSIYATYFESSGDTRTSSVFYSGAGIFAAAPNYWLRRWGDSGTWQFIENGQWNLSIGTNGDVSARAAVYCNPLFSYGNIYHSNSWNVWLGGGGEGYALVFGGGWYWTWNTSNGNMIWQTPNGWGFQLTGDRQTRVPSHLWVDGFVVCQGNSQGISFRSGAYNSGDVWVLGWGTMAGGYITCSANNGGAAYPLANAYSDRRLKRAIGDSTLDALAITNRMKLREYEILEIKDMWKLRKARKLDRKDKRMPRSRIGVIAQEVQEIFPEGVLPGDTQEDHIGGMWTLNISNWLALLVGCVQQLSNRIEELEAA